MSADAGAERGPFRPALVIGLVTAGLLSFAAFIALLGWGDGEQGQRGQQGLSGPAPSVAATGFAGLTKLSANFFPARMAEDGEDRDTYDLLVVALSGRHEPQEVADLLRRRRDQATLLILPKWAVIRDPQQRRWVRALGPWEAGTANWLMGEDYDVEQVSVPPGIGFARGVDLMEGVDPALPKSPQGIHGDNVVNLIGVSGEGSLVAQLGDQPHYVVADPDLLNNHGIRHAGTAAAAMEMLARMLPDEDSGILFDTGGALASPPRRNLLRAMFEPPFLAMTLALLVAALLAGLHGLGRFGPARRPVRAIPFGKAALVENSAGLVQLAGREARLGDGYAQLVRDEAARAGAAPSHLQGEALAKYLDRFTKPGETPFTPLAAAVSDARDRPTLLAAARALFAWKKDMIR